MKNIVKLIEEYKECECKCSTCKKNCVERPCWGVPEEINNIIDAGYGGKLMLDWYANGHIFDEYDNDIDLIAPAIKGREHKIAPFVPIGRCAFLNSKELCDLHDLNLKPLEGKLSSCKHSSYDIQEIHETIAMAWKSDLGEEVVEKWKHLREK